jgi:hypothetical protein
MKKLSNKGRAWLVTLVVGVLVFLFWNYRYPFALAYQEQLQLFLFDGDYLLERLSEPGGLARYVAEFLVQFYNGIAIGATIIAVLYMLIQRLTWQLMKVNSHYILSFIPVAMLWYAMGDESVMLTYAVALVMALAVMIAWTKLAPQNKVGKVAAAVVLIPVLYCLIGPIVLMVAVWMMPLSVIYAFALMLLSAHYLPFPMMRVMLGISYYRFPETFPYVLMAIPVVVLLLGWLAKRLPEPKTWVQYAEALLLAVLVVVPQQLGFDAKKYELMEYDYLVRIGDWNSIIAKAEAQTPDLPMSVSATNLALAMTNQLGDKAYNFYQRGSEGLLPMFERNFATTQLTGEIYYNLGLVNTAQRLAFEAMEAIPNYNKSARVVKRLAETNMINGEYKVAEKYLRMLEKTVFYRPWAQRMIQMLGNEKAINEHPLYGTLRQYRLQDDFLFSDRELDKICGLLFMHNNNNMVAAQYLLMMPLMDKDIARFMQYAPVVQSRVQYNPRHIQEGIALAFMQKRQQPPQGMVSQFMLQQMNEFARIYSTNQQAPELAKFKNTLWYYLMVGK